ncbi:A-kinase anchor protein 9-like [Megalops cyprinoides]|uniref:A-kinase anchor protein 9-like n=1 Tax=Megalops cyprinoides TaxID=118141 RepID=UPI0018651288|nr:A-kinase anchor protein 9-like [Megalops cyprinoides]
MDQDERIDGGRDKNLGITGDAASLLQDAHTLMDQEVAELGSDAHTGVYAPSLEDNADTPQQRLRAGLEAEQEVSQGEGAHASYFQRQPLQDRLTGLVQGLQRMVEEEEETGWHFRERYETDASSSELWMQILEGRKKLDLAQLATDHKAEVELIRKEHREQVWRFQKQHETRPDHGDQVYQERAEDLSKIKVHKGRVNQEVPSQYEEDMGLGASFPSGQDHLLEEYLMSVPQRDSSWAMENLEDNSLLEQAENDMFELDSEVVLDVSESRFSEESDEGSEAVDLRRTLLIQHCSDLTAQLEDREKQLEVLLHEVHTSRKDVREALEKYSKATEAVECVQQELEAERERRLQIEEIISGKTHEEDNLKKKLSHLQSQLENQEKSREGTDDLITELREEKQLLLVQLRQQEQLVRDVQEQKLAGDTVTSEMQALFGRQLSTLQTQRDRLQVMLDSQQDKNLTTSELLGQRTLELDSTLSKLKGLQAELMEREERLQKVCEEKNDLETRLACLQQNLVNVEQALSQRAEEKAEQERITVELEMKVKNTENILETLRTDFQNTLKEKDLALQRLWAESKKAEAERLEKEGALQTELLGVRQTLRDQEREHAEAVQSLLQKEAEKLHKAVEEMAAQLRRAHEEDACTLKEKHQEEVNSLKGEMERKISELRAVLEEEQKKQIALIKQVHEREREREMAELASRQQEALSQQSVELKESMEAAHQAELREAQAQWSLEMEALRLSLTNLHAAQLEEAQSNLQREKEEALKELQDSMGAKWSQDSTALQAQHQAEADRIQEQNREQARRVDQLHQQEMDNLKHAWETQMSKERTRMEEQHASQIEALRAEWQRESEKELRGTLTETLSAVRAQLEELQASRDQELRRLGEELSQACSDRDAAARAAEELVGSHKRALQERQDHARHLEELNSISAERERQLQQQVERLQAEYMALKSSSEQEVSHVRSQLECMKVNQHELGGLREQLLSCPSHAEDIERLKREFSEQRQHLQEHSEAELESLRSYLEQRLRSAEEGYREEIALLQTKLVERALEESVVKMGDVSLLLEDKVDEERSDLLAEINMKLENHKEELDALRLQLEEKHERELQQLRSNLTLAYREELLQVKTSLTDRYFSQIQDLKTKHALELEQQRAKLSDNHVKEITRLRLQSAQQAARQVEAELQERGRVLDEQHAARLAQVRSETERIQNLEAQMAALVKQRAEEMKQVEEQQEKLLREAKEKVKQAQREEREKANLERSRQKEEMARQREELLGQAEARLSALTQELERGAEEEREAFEQQIRGLQEQLAEEQRRLHALQDSLGNEQDPRILVIKQKIQAQFERELHVAKRTMAVEVNELNAVLQEQAAAKLQQAHSRFQEEKKELQEKLSQQQEAVLCELAKKHREELESQQALLDECVVKLKQLEMEYRHLEEKLRQSHGAELESLRAGLQEQSLAQLEAREAELQARHREESSKLEARMLSNMDTLESAYLKEIQAIRDERDQEIQELRDSFDKRQREREGGHAAELERLRAELQELRRKLVHEDQSSTIVSDVEDTSKRCSRASHLQGEPEGKHSEMEALESPLQPGGRENQEGGDPLSKLRADLRTAAKERKDLQQAYGRLHKVLTEVLRLTMATEEEINRRIAVCLEPSEDQGAEPHGKRPYRESRDSQEKGEEEREAVSDSSLRSALKGGGVEISHGLPESPFCRPEPEPEEEEMVLRVCVRLHSSVDKLLELIPCSTFPLEQTAGAQDRLEEQFNPSRLDLDLLVLQQNLHKAESLLESYDAEKEAMEEALRQKESRAQRLGAELEGLQVQLQELREEQTLLLRQREALTGGLGDREKALLEEAQRLMEEKLDVQRQAEKDQSRQASQLRLLEMELEEQESCRQELEEQHRAQIEDFQLQIQALEKQLRHHRQFIDEQAVEREHERDEFQLEIQKLEARLRRPPKPGQAAGGRGQKIEDLVLQVESLQTVIKEQIEDYNTLLLTKEQYRSSVSEQNEQIERMAGRICELEQALVDRTESRQALDQLEQELQVARTMAQDLLQDKEDLQQQLSSACLQISAVQCKQGDGLQHIPQSGAYQALREQLESALQSVTSRDEQLEQVQRDMSMEEEELIPQKLANQSSICLSQMQKEMDSEKGTASTLHSHREAGREESRASTLLVPFSRLEEKNREISCLNEEILRLQQEADGSKHKAVEEKQAEVEELRSQVERLHGDQARLRRDREEEVEQLHEVIHKLQEELAQMGPNRHEVSSSPEHSPAPGPQGLWPPHGREGSLCHELTPHCPPPPRARLRDLQEQLEQAVREREATQRLLQSQEEAFRSQVEVLSCTLWEEQERRGQLEQECSRLRVRLSQQQGGAEGRGRLLEAELLVRRAEEWTEQGREAGLEEELHHMQGGAQELLHSRSEDTPLDKPEREEEGVAAAETPRTVVKEQGAQVQESQAEIHSLETAKEEVTKLRRSEGRLQQEIQRLKQEVMSKSSHIQELNTQLEAQREVLTFSEETLAKAGGVLRENERQLDRLGAERDALRAELVAVKAGLSSSAERAEKLLEEGQTKDKALRDLEIHNHQLKSELQGLQEGLAVQEEELAHQQRELELLQYHCSAQGSSLDPSTPHKAEALLSALPCEGSQCSPELLHEPLAAGVHASLPPELSTQHMKASGQAKEGSQPTENKPTPQERPSTRSPGSASASENLSALHPFDADKVNALGDVDLTRAEQWAGDGECSTADVSSELGGSLQVELDRTECLNASFIEYLRSRGMAVADSSDSTTESVDQCDELLSPELEGLLKRVYQEGFRVLSLSHRPAPSSLTPPTSQAPPLTWQTEKRALQETVLSLRELLCKMADREHKVDSREADWRREFLREVRSMCHSETARLSSELQSVISSLRTQDPPLMDQLERLLKQQEEQQRRALEQLLCADRRSLLEEMQQLQALLQASCLKNQEQLQQLQASLNAEAKGRQEQQREREGPLAQRAEPRGCEDQLALLKVGQGEELKKGEGLEQQEEDSGQDDLHFSTASKTQQELHNENCKPRLESEGVEQRDQERLRSRSRHEQEEQQVQERLRSRSRHEQEEQQVQERLRSRSRHEQEEQMHQELRLEERAARNRQLELSLEQERVVSAHLRNQLQEESQRQEEAASQDRELIEELRVQLERERVLSANLRNELQEERSHSSALLSRERRQLEEQLQEVTRRHEAAASQDRAFMAELRAQLQQERGQGEELAAMLEGAQRRAVRSERQLEQEVQRRCEAARREQEAARSLEEERQRAARLQAELDALAEELLALKEDQRETQERERRYASTCLRPVEWQQPVDVAVLSERLSWQKEHAALRVALQRTGSELSQNTAELENKPLTVASNSKAQRMYRKYLRAESFRKALVYQKRYLLRLLDSFQDCERAILTLTARMGTYPSPGDPQAPLPYPVNRFRTAVHVVIAILRLAFLVRKWQKAFRIGPAATTSMREPGHGAGSNTRAEGLRRQQLGVISSLATCDARPHPEGCGLEPTVTHPFPLPTARQVVTPSCPDSYRASPLTVPGSGPGGQPAAVRGTAAR